MVREAICFTFPHFKEENSVRCKDSEVTSICAGCHSGDFKD